MAQNLIFIEYFAQIPFYFKLVLNFVQAWTYEVMFSRSLLGLPIENLGDIGLYKVRKAIAPS